MVSTHYLENYYRAFIFHMQIGLDEDKNAIDFGFTRSKVKVTRVTFVKICFPHIFLRTICHKAFIFHMLIRLVEDMTNINFGFSRLKVKDTRVTCKKMQTWFPIIILRTIYPELLYVTC